MPQVIPNVAGVKVKAAGGRGDRTPCRQPPGLHVHLHTG